MNFNDLTVKITSNENYQSLQPNKQEQIKALIKGYESYAQNITQSFYDNIAKMQKETQDKIKNAKTWGTILNFASLGTYPTVKGLVNGLTDLATGVINIRTQLVNNIGQIYAQDGRFGGGIDGFFKELGSDWLYTVADPIISVAEGLIKGGGSVANIFGWDDKEFNRFLDLTTNWSLYERDRILTLGEKEDDSFSRISWFLNDTSSPDKGKLIKEHTWDWARDFSIAVAQGGTWFKDNVSPVIGKMIIPLGIAIDDLGQNEVGEFFSGTMESVGRMIPAIVAAYFGDATALATAASQIYFFSSSFGNGFSEAIARGATLEEAYTYGYGTAAIETLTEQIGGVQIGKLLPGGVATKVATSKFGKVLQHPVMRVIKAGIDEGFEEVMSEAMSAGLESIISDDPVSNQDFMSRAMSAFLGGAISGGVFGSAGYYAHQKSTVGKVNSLNKEIKRIYEGQNKDYGKAQQVFNQKVDSLLNSYNRDSVVDNNLIEEGKRTPESRIQAKKDLLEKSGFASALIEYNEQNQNFQLTKKGIEMTTDLEGYMGDSNKNAYSSTLYGLEDTLATKVTNQELNSEQQDVMKLSKKLGSDVVFYTDSDTSINGFFNDGIVYLNTESKKSYLTNFIHELTHSLEGTKQYDTLKNFLMEISETNEILKAKMEELGLTKESIIKDYWNQISNLKNIESKAYLMASEYVAFAMSEVILKDKASIESLTKNKTIGRKILNWIKEKIADIKTPKTDIEKAFLKDLKHAKDLYEEALGVGYRKGLKIGEVDKRFSFIGEMGIENYITNEYIKDSGLDSVAKGLKDAKKMFDDGFNNQEILEKTGWYFSKDGNWKFEISDKEASVKKEFEIKLNEIIEKEELHAFYLSEILNNDKLYKLYPSLKKLDVYIAFYKNESFSGYFSSENRKRIVLNIDALNKDKEINRIKNILESYKKDLKTLEEIRKVFDTDKNKAIELFEKLETGNNSQFGSMIFEKNFKGDFEGIYKDGLLVSFTKDINGIDFLIKNTEINIKNNEELLKTVKKVDGEHFILPILLHEIQHYIQAVELWSNGGNLKDGFIYMIQDFLRKNKMVDSFNEMSRYDREDFLFETFKNYPTIAQRFYNYLMFLGEVEARTVEKNRTLSQEEINNAKDISHEDNAIVKDSSIEYLNPVDKFYYSLAMKEMLLGFNEFERPNNSELENNKDIYDDELKKSLDNAIDFYNSDIRYSIKVGDKIFKIPKSITGFFNSNVEGNLEASIDEVHYIKANLEGDRKERKYSEKSKAELEKFFKLFDSFDNMGNNMDAIVDNLLLEYGNQIEYKEIIGTKYVYIWVLTSHNNEIRNLLIENVEARVNATLNEARKNKTITLDENVEGLYKVNDTSTFRKVFALNYIVADPKYAASVSLYDTRTYANEARDMFLFNDGFGGFIVSKDELLIDNSYKNENAEKYQYRTAFESSELSSVFNNGELKISKEMINYMTNGLGVKNIVATNTKLESIYKSWGFKETDIRYNYDNKIMSEWSNSYNNYLLFNSEQNNVSPIYSNLQMMKKAEEGRKIRIENMKDIRFSKTTDSEGRKLTVEQEKYFKDSKVRDKQGNLLVMYHGSSSADFNVFDANKIGENFPSYSVGGFYFTNKKQTAEYYGKKGHIKEVYLNLENPYILKADEDWGNGSDWFDINSQQHYEQAIQNGNDGIMVEQKYGNMVLAFESNQIKNINNLNPTSSEDIRYSRSNLDIKISNEKIFSGNDERNMRSFTYGDGKGYDIDGGFISVIENSPYSPVKGNSIYDFFVNEEKRRKGIGTELFQKALKEFGGKLSGQFSSEQSVKIAWENGLRNSEYKTLDEALKAMKENSSVFLEIGYNLTPTSDSDVRYSRDLNKGVKTETEIPFVEKFINESYNNFNKKQLFIDNNLRTKDFNNVFSKKKEISKRKNGKKIVAILEKFEKDYAYIIRKQDIRGELYNYLFNNVLEQITIELDSNFNENVFNNKEQVVNNIERVISNTMAYLDNTFNNNELNISNSNPQGFQYTRGFNWAMREFNVKNKDMELIKKGVGNIVNLIDAVINLDLTDNKSIDMFMAGIGSFRKATHVEQRNSLAIETSGNRVHTLPNVLRQNSVHIDALTKINGNYGKNVYNKGLLGYDFMKGLNNPLLDMYAFGNIFGMGMEKSLGNVITKQLEKATIKQLTVTNRFNEFFEKDGFIKENTDNFNRIESEVVEVSNLIDKNGEKIFIPKSQIITLRNIMLREIIRNRLIENGFRGGELSNKFNKDMLVYFNGNSDNNLKNKKDRRSFKIKNTFDLFNELDDIVNKDSFMKKYNKKILSFFETMYEYENIAYKDLRGRELTNDKVFIENLSEQERIVLKQGLNDNVDISLIYVPMTSLNESGQSGGGAFDINRVIDLGIDDGMVMGIQENENPSLIDSVNIVVPKYAKSVSNFYGLYRITEDLNLLFNKEIYINSKQKITLKAKVDNLNPNIIKFYETLLRNMSGYQIEKDSLYGKVNKTLGVVKRNYYKATLGANFKVIATQFASLFTTGTMYGDFKGTKKSLTLGMWKNVFVKGSKTKAKYLIENSEIYKDRARNSINEVSESRSSKFNRSRFNRFTEFTMKGINLTDSMINRALFITLVEHGYSEQQALKMTEQAILRYQSSGVAIGKNSLLRTEHEVVKLLTKFLSEPMKVVSNVTESANILKVIKNLEKNKASIMNHFENELSNLIKENDKLKNDLSKLDEKVDKELIKELKTEIKFNDDKILDLERYNKTIENQINNVIESKGETIKVFAKRLTGAMLSLLWQTSLGVIFSQMRFGNDDKDEDEETWVYLSKKFGWQFASEFIGYIPIGRDIYGMIIDGFDINVIDELNVYNDFLSNVSGLYKDIANGGDFDWGKHLRKSAITIGQLTGIPTKNIERLFTTPSKMFSKSTNYIYRDMTGQYIGSNELNNAIKNGDEKLIETIINRKMNEKNLSLTFSTTKEINRLAKNGVVVNPSGIPNSFSIDGVEYKNDKDKFAETYNNATFVVEKIITLNGYKRLNDEYKAKLVKAIFTYYHSLAKQNVSGVQIFTKERTYNLKQAYGYFRDRISYYMNQQQKEKKKREPN